MLQNVKTLTEQLPWGVPVRSNRLVNLAGQYISEMKNGVLTRSIEH